MGSFVAFPVLELPARPVVLGCIWPTLKRYTRSWVRPHFYFQMLVKERKERNVASVRAEGQVCGWCWHLGEVWEEEIWALGRATEGEEVGEHHVPTAKLSWQSWKRCCQIKKFLPNLPEKLPRLGCDGNSSKAVKHWCMQLFKQQGEEKEQRVEVHISKMSEY